MPVKLTNNASSLLASPIDEAATSLSITPGDGAKFPMLSAGEWSYLTAVKLVDGVPFRETMKVIARTNDVFTVVRAQEGTTALTFAAGDIIDCRFTAAALDSKADLDGAAFMGPVSMVEATFTGPVAMSDQEFSGAVLKDCGNKVGTVPAAVANVVTIDYRNGSYQTWTPPPGTYQVVITNWPPAGINGELWIEGVNLGLCTITTQVALDYLKPDGSYTTTASLNTNQGATLRNAGVDNVLIWGREGAPKRAKVAR